MFNGKVVAITGGSSGIGKAVAAKFSNEGAKVAILGRDKEKLEQVRISLQESIAVAGDVCKTSDLDLFFQITKDNLGNIDILVACAGVASRRHVDGVDENYFDEMVNINFKGVYFTVKQAIPYLNNNASIVLISSMVCHSGWSSHSVYSATKSAVSQLAKNFSADLIQQGIRVNSISPGYTTTEMYLPDFIIQQKKSIPTGEFAKPEEIADAVAFLSSSSATSIVGADLIIDGGITSIIKE